MYNGIYFVESTKAKSNLEGVQICKYGCIWVSFVWTARKWSSLCIRPFEKPLPRGDRPFDATPVYLFTLHDADVAQGKANFSPRLFRIDFPAGEIRFNNTVAAWNFDLSRNVEPRSTLTVTSSTTNRKSNVMLFVNMLIGAALLTIYSIKARESDVMTRAEYIYSVFIMPTRDTKQAKKAGNAEQRIFDEVKKKKKRQESYSIYVYKILRQIDSEIGISGKAMIIMNNLLQDIFERIANEASQLTKHNHQKTITSRDIETAIKLLLPGELAKHAVSEGTKAVTLYMRSK